MTWLEHFERAARLQLSGVPILLRGGRNEGIEWSAHGEAPRRIACAETPKVNSDFKQPATESYI